MKRSLSANPSSYGFRKQASYILLYIKYQCIILWSCCFVVLLFSDFVECISNAINKTTKQPDNTNVFFSIDILFLSIDILFLFIDILFLSIDIL